jgi:hypothetical protein
VSGFGKFPLRNVTIRLSLTNHRLPTLVALRDTMFGLDGQMTQVTPPDHDCVKEVALLSKVVPYVAELPWRNSLVLFQKP